MTTVATWLGERAKAPLHALARRAARSYIAGPCLANALAVADGLSAQGLRTTLGYWDAVGTKPERVFTAYCDALDGLRASRRDSYLSIKLPALGFSRELVEALVLRAKERDIRLHFDAMAPETVDQTWQAIQLACAKGSTWGVPCPRIGGEARTTPNGPRGMGSPCGS